MLKKCKMYLHCSLGIKMLELETSSPPQGKKNHSLAQNTCVSNLRQHDIDTICHLVRLQRYQRDCRRCDNQLRFARLSHDSKFAPNFRGINGPCPFMKSFFQKVGTRFKGNEANDHKDKKEVTKL